MIKVIIDSTCDLSQEYIEKYDIKMIPLTITIDGIEYKDKVDIDHTYVQEKIDANADIKTSLPYSQDIYDMFREYASIGQDFIFISFSSDMSGTYNHARNILQDVQEEYPDVKMGIVDSRAGALATGLIAINTAKMAQKEESFEEVLEYSKYLTQHIKLYFMVNDLSQLAKGGRISKAAAAIGNTLNIRPILQVSDGEIKLLTQIRGTKKALKKLVKLVMDNIGDPKQLLAVNYSRNIDLADTVIEEFTTNQGIEQTICEPIGSVLTTHIGNDAVGVYFFDI